MTGHGPDFYPGDAEYGDRDYTQDPALRDTAGLVDRVMHSPHMRPAFRDQLRAQLVAGRAEAIRRGETAPAPIPVSPPPARPVTRPMPPQPPQRPAGSRPAGRPAPRKRFWRPATVGWLGAVTAAAAAVVVFVALGLPALRHGTGSAAVALRSDVGGNVSVDAAAAVRLTFSQPVDHNATLSALRLTPYADTNPTWDGNTLVVTPQHGFAPNTGYLVTIDHTVARTAAGSALASDLHVAFGTSGAPGIGPEPAPAVDLHRNTVGPAEPGSEAVVTRDGALLLTQSTGNHRGLVRVTDHSAQTISAATDAICVSRSGDSIAYLDKSGSGTEVVFANSEGIGQGHKPVAIDGDSPLGWINDDLVTYVSQHKLLAIDRDGNVKSLGVTVDPERQAFVIAPGGGYVYVEGQGVIALSDHKAHPLHGIAGAPAFSADGATVVWIDNSTGTPQLSVAPSAGGAAFVAPLPDVKAGDRISDLSVSPDGSRLAYTLTHDNHAELRLASLPDGDTLAVSADGAGASPNWSRSGRVFTVLSGSGHDTRIDTVTLPQAVRDKGAAIEATADAFVNAQRSGDTDAQRALAAGDVAAPRVAGVATRATVVWVLPNGDGTVNARIRFSTDPTAAHPVATQAEETLTLGVPQGGVLPKVLKVAGSGQFAAAPSGPQVVHVDTDAFPGEIVVAFDSDLNWSTVPAAIRLTTPGGRAVSYTPKPDEAHRSIRLVPSANGGRLVLHVDKSLRDAKGNPMADSLDVALSLAG